MEVRDLIEWLSRVDGHLKVRVEAPGYETEKWCHGCKVETSQRVVSKVLDLDRVRMNGGEVVIEAS